MPTNLDSMFDRVSSLLDKVQIVQFQKMNKSKNEFSKHIRCKKEARERNSGWSELRGVGNILALIWGGRDC